MQMKTSIMSTFNVPCGIATYSAFLAEGLVANLYTNFDILAEKVEVLNQKEVDPIINVPYTRSWARGTYCEIENESDVIHIQHQFGLFPSLFYLTEVLKLCRQKAKKVVFTLHDVIPKNPEMTPYFDTIEEYCDDIIVHSQPCFDLYKKDWSKKATLHLIPHGTKIVAIPDKFESRRRLRIPEDKFVILSWGFIWESKGLDHSITALSHFKKDVPNAMYIHAGAIHSLYNRTDYIKKCYITASRLGLKPSDVVITNTYIPEADIPYYFGASDIIVLPYMRGSLSASGAAHRVCSSHRPIVAYDDPCLADIPCYKTPPSAQALYGGIREVYKDKNIQKELVDTIDEYAKKTSWVKIAKEHLKVYAS